MEFINQRQIFFGSGKATGRHDGRFFGSKKLDIFQSSKAFGKNDSMFFSVGEVVPAAGSWKKLDN